jgi:hypothetical protein
MTATTETEVDRLEAQIAALDEQEQGLATQLRETEGRIAGPTVAAERDSVIARIREVGEKRLDLRHRLAVAEEAAKRKRYEETLASPEYRAACLAGLRALEPVLGPWASLYAFTCADRRLTPMPPTLALLGLQFRGWAEPLLRHGVLKMSDIPQGLRPFLKEGLR